MYHDNLKERILIEPVVSQDYKTLCVVSGYAEPRMVETHLVDWLQNQSPRGYQYPINLKLLIGMFPKRDWPGENNRRSRESYFIKVSDFAKLSGPVGAGATFECRYVLPYPQLHAKLYVWLDKNDDPARAFLGSPNYTKSGFDNVKYQGEIATVDGDPEVCHDYFLQHWTSAVPCTEPDIEDRFRRVVKW